jgi:exonuclease VII large subunit
VQLLNPKSQLKRGYALVYNDKGRAKTPEQLKGTLRIILDTGEAKGTFTPQ